MRVIHVCTVIRSRPLVGVDSCSVRVFKASLLLRVPTGRFQTNRR